MRRTRGQDQFPNPFGRAHDVGGIYRFIGGDHHESFSTLRAPPGSESDQSQHVVFDCLLHVLFHHRNMLVGRGMKHNLRPDFAQKSPSPSRSVMSATQNDTCVPFCGSANPASEKTGRFRSGPNRSAVPGHIRESAGIVPSRWSPAAPVTTTVRPAISRRTDSRSIWAGSRPSKSSRLTSRSWLTVICPAMMSFNAGKVRKGIFASVQICTNRCICLPLADGTAISISSTG